MTLEEFNQRYTAKLNEQQQEAVHAIDGAVLLLAVPGSGKTTVLVTRLGYMVYCCNTAPSSILTMTYTVANIKVGRRIEHKSFGQGMILAIKNDIVDIRFDKNNQTKHLLLSKCLQDRLLKLSL